MSNDTPAPQSTTALTDYQRGLRRAAEIALTIRNQHSDAAYDARDRRDGVDDREHQALMDGADIITAWTCPRCLRVMPATMDCACPQTTVACIWDGPADIASWGPFAGFVVAATGGWLSWRRFPLHD